jgi:formate-dependent nitrite reductase membrane component NrfD
VEAISVTEVRTYHGQPVLKEPVWSWEIPCYFFTGGLAGASAGLAYLCELRGDEAAGRRAWTVAIAGISASPLLLISDLGRPARFLGMLRMMKVTSPMSIGSWILTVSGTSTALAAAHARLGLFPGLARIARPVAALAGLPLSSYTAALVTNTAVPVWHEARATLPFVFVAGAGLSAGAALVLLTPVEDARIARRVAVAGTVGELALTELMQRRLGRPAQAYKSGAPRAFDLAARGAVAVGGGLLVTRGRRSRPAAAAAGALLLAGALCARWSIFTAGFASARDPAVVIGPQRERLDRNR